MLSCIYIYMFFYINPSVVLQHLHDEIAIFLVMQICMCFFSWSYCFYTQMIYSASTSLWILQLLLINGDGFTLKPTLGRVEVVWVKLTPYFCSCTSKSIITSMGHLALFISFRLNTLDYNIGHADPAAKWPQSSPNVSTQAEQQSQTWCKLSIFCIRKVKQFWLRSIVSFTYSSLFSYPFKSIIPGLLVLPSRY